MTHTRRLVVFALASASILCLVTPHAKGASQAKCTLTGTPGPDRLKGTLRRDVICGLGGADTLKGLAGDDRLVGGNGNDVLLGGAGNDTLVGGPGRDKLIGGPGRNTCPSFSPADDGRCSNHRRRRLLPRGRVFSPIPPPAPPPQVCGVATRPPDECPPELLGVSASPKSADVNLGPADADLTVLVEDESPIATVRARLRGPSGFERNLTLAPTNALEYEFVGSTVIPESAGTGTYWIDQVSLADSAGNSVLYEEAALASGGFGYAREIELYKGPDNEGPTLEDLTITPQSVDTSGDGATVTMTVQASDSLSGVESVGGSFDMPNTLGNYGFAMSRVRGKAPDGEWEIRIQLPRYAAPGDWKLDDLHLSDNAGNSTGYADHSELESLPFPTTFTQTGPGDTTPPQILGLSIEETASSGQQNVYFDVHLADDLAGINVVDNCLSLRLRSVAEPAYGFGVTSPIQVSGTALDGVLRIGTVFPSDAPPGTYVVESIEACDLTWNTVELSGAELEAKGWDLTFENPG